MDHQDEHAAPGETVVLNVSAGRQYPLRQLRQQLRETFSYVETEQAEAIQLVFSELIANAYDHAGGPTGVRVLAAPDHARIETDDPGEAAPQVLPPDNGRDRGRGMLLVDALTTSWGVITREGGKTVWAELPLTHTQCPLKVTCPRSPCPKRCLPEPLTA